MKLVPIAALVAMTLAAAAQPAFASKHVKPRAPHATKHTAANPATTENAVDETKAAAPLAPISLATVIVSPATLPVGQMLDLRRDARPSELPASAKIDGVKIEMNDMNSGRAVKKKGGQHYLEIKNDVDTDTPGFDPSEQQTCYEVARSISRRTMQMRKKIAGKNPVPMESDEEEEHWSNSLSWQVTMMRQQPQPGQPPEDDRVQLVHAESFQPAAGGTGSELVTRDIWVDATTGGARVQHEAHLPLRDLGATLPGVHLYAGKTDAHIVYVATHDKNIDSLFASEPDGNVNSGNCGHMSLAVETTQGYSAMSQYIVRTSRHVPVKTLIPSTDDSPTADGKPQESDSEDILQRMGHISLSTQWEADEKEPLLAYSAGWDTREHTTN